MSMRIADIQVSRKQPIKTLKTYFYHSYRDGKLSLGHSLSSVITTLLIPRDMQYTDITTIQLVAIS